MPAIHEFLKFKNHEFCISLTHEHKKFKVGKVDTSKMFEEQLECSREDRELCIISDH